MCRLTMELLVLVTLGWERSGVERCGALSPVGQAGSCSLSSRGSRPGLLPGRRQPAQVSSFLPARPALPCLGALGFSHAWRHSVAPVAQH